MSEAVICTIITKRYLAHARVLAKTFLDHHPAGRVFALLVDEVEGAYDPTAEAFTTIPLGHLNLPEPRQMLFRYTLFELSCALKPYCLEYLFNEYDYDKICYFDSDMSITAPLDEIFGLLDSNLMVLTPHLLDFLEDQHQPDEPSILQAGAYNLGCIGVARHPELARFLGWWQRKLEKQCVVDVERGLFVDQRWLDLAPGLFAGVHIHRDPACNVAYWNLKNRSLERTHEGFAVNGSPLKFFHFSGFSVENIETISRHQSRYRLSDLPHLRPIYEQYRDQLLENGYARVKALPCVYDSFDNGVSIPDIARYIWRSVEKEGERWPDPFQTHGRDSFIAWLNAPADKVGQKPPLLTNLTVEFYRRRVDLHSRFPDILGKDRPEFARWFIKQADQDDSLDDFFVEPIRHSLSQVFETKALGSSAESDDISWSAKLYLQTKDFLNRVGIGPRVRAVVGAEQVWKVRQLFFYGKISDYNLHRPGYVPPPPAAEAPEPAGQNGQPKAGQKPPFGLNVIGYLRDEIGVGEVARSILKALDEKDFPVAQVSVTNKETLAEDTSVLHLPTGNPYAVNLCNVNADAAAGLHQYLGPDFFQNRYNIGFWFWELAHFPQVWYNSFAYFDEIWVGSSFVQGVITPFAPIPVVNVRVPVIKPAPSPVTRTDLGLPEDKHIFLFVFDGLSFVERKNPLELIQAYRTAFEPRFKETTLVIKATGLHRNPKLAHRLKQQIDGISGILIDKYMSREALNGLFQTCDTYVSLHRSEGFGLTMAEAMSLGKAVIATAYSANMDFMTAANSYPVPYRLVEIEEDYGPYQSGNLWAAPDITEAAALMRRVVTNPEEAQQKGALAQQDIERLYSTETVAKIIINRLETIRRWL